MVARILTELTFGCGVRITNRIAMAPMVAQGADPITHRVTEEDLQYFSPLHRRYGGHAILEGTLLAVAGTVIAQAALAGVQVREVAGRMLSE